MKVVCIIQARMSSTRLPGKVMLDICGKTVLEHVIQRVKRVKNIDEIVIATTTDKKDNVIVDETMKCGVEVFRGSEQDVLSRYYYAAKENKADVVVRITSDCPLIDPEVTKEVIEFYLKSDYDLVTNGGLDLNKRTYPRGLDVAVFSYKVLEKAFINAKEQYQREHVTPYIYEYENIYYYKNDSDYSNHRWTLDTKEDYELIKAIYTELYNENLVFYLNDVLKLLKHKPNLTKINRHIEQKKVK